MTPEEIIREEEEKKKKLSVFQRIKQQFQIQRPIQYQQPIQQQAQPRMLSQQEINQILNRPQYPQQPRRRFSIPRERQILNSHRTNNLWGGQRQFQPQRNVADSRGNLISLMRGTPLAPRLRFWR